MPQAELVSNPPDEFKFVAAANLASGDIVFDAMLRAGVVVGMTGVKTGKTGSAVAEGRFKVTAKVTDTFAAGALVYWDAALKQATSTSAGNSVIGRADAAKANGDTTVIVLLNHPGKSV